MNAGQTRHLALCLLAVFTFLTAVPAAEAYVGPGAGFAFVSSFFVLFITFALALLTLLTWPLRFFVHMLLKWKRERRSRVKRVILVGLDGQDPDLTEQYMRDGLLPHFTRLSHEGTFCKLQTTLPAESPVAWSSFQTGCNPGKHRIYDFLVPNRKSMLPELSSARVSPSPYTLNIGKYRIPLRKPIIQVGRKSQPFWKILGRHGVFSSVLRVPITFPPEKFRGVLLSAMCVPDLKGSQGTYFYYTSNGEESRALTSGAQLPLHRRNGVAQGFLSGPENTLTQEGGELKMPFELRVLQSRAGEAELILDGEIIPLQIGQYSPWTKISFKAGLGIKVQGICRFLLLETDPDIRLYVTPIQIDPEKPALPISYPSAYSIYLAKSQGTFATLGVAEDTSGLNENILDEAAFLRQCYDIHKEREMMFFDALEKTPEGCVVCVFDITDRVQHMFMRCLDGGHPANRGRDIHPYRDTIRELYQRMDELVGRILNAADPDTVVMVMSDHGFKPFRRGVNLNAWLKSNGYLAVKPDAAGRDMLQDVDWSRTRAYAVGFGGIYLNLAGRESQGIVNPGRTAEALKREIAGRLAAWTDEETGERPVKKVYDRDEAYSGPYVNDAPDLVAGFRVGYRAAWECVTGGIGDVIVSDNDRPWGGDHNMNPPDVPGMFFCNRPIASPHIHIQDIAPTVLDLFGVPAPAYMDGRSFMPDSSGAGPASER